MQQLRNVRRTRRGDTNRLLDQITYDDLKPENIEEIKERCKILVRMALKKEDRFTGPIYIVKFAHVSGGQIDWDCAVEIQAPSEKELKKALPKIKKEGSFVNYIEYIGPKEIQ